ncbi:hypothetical protein ISN44_As04g032500, partial [Arabidopsis suecica]
IEVLKWVKDLHTKVAATAFNIPLSSVFVSETSTYKVPNASQTVIALLSF